MLLVEDLAFGDPRGDQDRRDAVARPVEAEPELAAGAAGSGGGTGAGGT